MSGAQVQRPLQLGFLGLGWIGRNRLEALQDEPAIEIRALCEPERSALLEAQKLAPRALLARNFAGLLELDLDGLVIATPSALHAEQTLIALEHGLPVFCQKPLGRDAHEVERIVRSAEQRDLRLGVDLSYRHTAAVQELQQLVRSGALGRIFSANLVFHNAYGPDKTWFYDPKLAGGGALMDLGIHLVDLLLWLLDFPEVTGVTSQLFVRGQPLADRNAQVEDYAAAQLELAPGIAAQLACSWRLHAGSDCVIELSLYGTEGGASLRNQHGSFYDFQLEAYSGTSARRLIEPPDAWGGRSLRAWARALAQDRRFDPEARRYLDVARTLDRIYQAAAG